MNNILVFTEYTVFSVLFSQNCLFSAPAPPLSIFSAPALTPAIFCHLKLFFNCSFVRNKSLWRFFFILIPSILKLTALNISLHYWIHLFCYRLSYFGSIGSNSGSATATLAYFIFFCLDWSVSWIGECLESNRRYQNSSPATPLPRYHRDLFLLASFHFHVKFFD